LFKTSREIGPGTDMSLWYRQKTTSW